MSCWGHNNNGQVLPLLLFYFVGTPVCWGRNSSRAEDVFFVQIGDGTMTQRNTPVYVGGLSSGLQMIALGSVRIVVIAERAFVFCERDHGVFK